MTTPLRTRWAAYGTGRLIRLWVHVLRKWRACLVGQTIRWLTFEKRKTCLDVHIVRIQVSRSCVRIEGITRLIVARFVLRPVLAAKRLNRSNDRAHQSTEIVPNLGDVGIQSDCSGVRVQCVTVLVDLVVEHADRAPECRIATISVDCLLIGFVGFGILLL